MENIAAPDIDDNILHEIKKLISSDKDVRKNAETELFDMIWIIDYLTNLDDKQITKILPGLIKICIYRYDLADLVYFAFRDKKVSEGSTVDDLTENQMMALQTVIENTITGKEQVYQRGLEFMGIKFVSSSLSCDARNKLIRFMSGERLEYDEFLEK